MIPINAKMMEALLFMLDNQPLLLDRLDSRWSTSTILRSIAKLYDPVERCQIPLDLDDVDRDVLRECIEGSVWLQPYVQHAPGNAHLEEARATLRDLARLLEPHGIEITNIPYV